MIEHVHPDQFVHSDAQAESPFSAGEQKSFDADDANAGRAIGKMLALFFLYTVAAMSLVTWWTMSSLE